MIAALLHDVGKVEIPIEILDKPGKLTDEEFTIIKRHPAIGMITFACRTIFARKSWTRCIADDRFWCQQRTGPIGVRRELAAKSQS